MKTKKEIVDNWLPRYTGEKLSNFGEYILLTNFSNYVKMFADIHGVEVVGVEKAMECATADNITIINFGMGSPGVKEHPMTTFHLKYPRFLHLRFRKRYLQLSGIMHLIIGQVLCIRLTGVCGSMTKPSKVTCVK